MMSMNSKQAFSMHPILHEPKYPHLHSSSEAIRRACLPAPQVSPARLSGASATADPRQLRPLSLWVSFGFWGFLLPFLPPPGRAGAVPGGKGVWGGWGERGRSRSGAAAVPSRSGRALGLRDPRRLRPLCRCLSLGEVAPRAE